MSGVEASVPAELLAGAAQRVGLVLVGGLGAIAVAPRSGPGDRRTLLAMWRTWLVVAPVYVLGVTLSSATALGLAVGLAMQALREYAELVGLQRRDRTALLAAGAVVVLVPLLAREALPLLVPIAAASLAACSLVTGETGAGVRGLAWSTLGLSLVAWPLASLATIRAAIPGGAGLLLAIGAGVAFSDILAFAVGRAVASRPLAPRVSPAKTRVGLLGNLIGAFLGVWIMAFALPAWLPPAARLLLPLAIAVGAAWGDLVESLLKRHAGVKDAGRILPGFGGLLDRIDSLLVALPLAHVVLVASR